MNAFALLSLLSAIMSSFLGIFVYSKDTKNSVNRLFMLSCLSLSYWAFTEFGLRQAESFDSASFWITINFLWPFTLAFLLHFTLVFTEHSEFFKTKATYALIYAPTALISFLALNIAPGTPVRTYWGWTYTFFENILVFYISATWAVALGILVLYLILRYYMRTDQRRKQQTKYILIGFSFPVIIGSLTEGILPLLSIKIPELTNSSFVLGSIFIAYAILEYDLFVLTPATAAENIIATVSDPLFLVSPDRKIVSVNQTTLELLGYEKKELIGKPMKSILTEDSEKNLFRRIEHNKLIGERSNGDIETVFKTKDARIVSISLSASIMHATNGEIQGIIFIGRDVTERKQTEERIQEYTENLERLVKESLLELKESEARYQELYESSIDGIALTNKNAQIVDCNQAFADMIGYTKEELYQRTLYDITPPKWHETNKKIFTEQVFVRGRSDEYEKEYIKKDGTVIPISAKAWVIKDKDGKILGSWGIIRDITERKKLDQMKSNFINVAAHELRTPLSALKAHVDLLKIKSEQGYWELPQEVHEKIKIITRNADRLALLINNLLDYTRLEAGTVKLKLEENSLEKVIRQVIKEIMPLAKKYGHDLDLTVSKTLPSIYMDLELLHRIFNNLISNAIKYTPNGGKINIEVFEEPNNLHTTVKDNGIGIAKEDLEKIFQPFHVTDAPDSVLFQSEFERTGLGLAITREYVRLHGGKIWVESQIGEGSTFHVILPKRANESN